MLAEFVRSWLLERLIVAACELDRLREKVLICVRVRVPDRDSVFDCDKVLLALIVVDGLVVRERLDA